MGLLFQGICAKKKLVKFNRLWKKCSQEEDQILSQEEKMGSEDQALTVHSKKNRRSNYHSKGKISHSRKYLNTIRCYTCDEKGHISKFYPKKRNLRKNNKRRNHAHAADNDEPSTKRFRQESDGS